MRIGTRAILFRIALSATSVLGACAHFWTPAPAVPIPMKAEDPRRALLGEWRFSLIVDTVMGAPFAQSPDPGSVGSDSAGWAFASLHISDTLRSQRDPAVLAVLTPCDTAPLDSTHYRTAGAVLTKSWLAHSDAIYFSNKGVKWSFGLTPNVWDAGLELTGVLNDDSLDGVWHELGFAGYVSSGRFRMRRLVTTLHGGLTSACS